MTLVIIVENYKNIVRQQLPCQNQRRKDVNYTAIKQNYSKLSQNCGYYKCLQTTTTFINIKFNFLNLRQFR